MIFLAKSTFGNVRFSTLASFLRSKVLVNFSSVFWSSQISSSRFWQVAVFIRSASLRVNFVFVRQSWLLSNRRFGKSGFWFLPKVRFVVESGHLGGGVFFSQ